MESERVSLVASHFFSSLPRSVQTPAVHMRRGVIRNSAICTPNSFCKKKTTGKIKRTKMRE